MEISYAKSLTKFILTYKERITPPIGSSEGILKVCPIYGKLSDMILKTTSFKLSCAIACTPEDFIFTQNTQTIALTITVIAILSIPANGKFAGVGSCCNLERDSKST